MNILITIALIALLFYYCNKSTDNSMCKLVMWISVGVLFYSILAKPEGFEITPWKKTCLNNDPSPCCCPAGFHGRRIGFEYSDDAERLQCGNTQPITANQMMALQSTLQTQSDFQENFESGCGCG